VRSIQIPLILIKSANKKEKTLLIYLAFLKSFTNSDRLKFNNLNELKELTGISKGQLSKVINILIQNKYIEYFFHNKENLLHLKFKSWKKIIEEFQKNIEAHQKLKEYLEFQRGNIIKPKKNKKIFIRRQKIKFLKIEINFQNEDKHKFSHVIKAIYKKIIEQNLKNQEYHIEKKLYKYAIAEELFERHEKKIKEVLKIPDSEKKGAALQEFFKKIKEKQESRYFRKLMRKGISEKKYFFYRINLFKASLKNFSNFNYSKDIFFKILSCRGIAKHLNLSYVQANNVLNELNFELRKYQLSDNEKKINYLKKRFEEYFYSGHSCIFLRAY
jgi:hypothetical protein